jgi:hypothetical protein
MFTWIKNLFSKKAPVVTPEVLYCKNDGEKLVVTQTVIDYSPYTGKPATYKIKKTCPVCDAEPETSTVIS